MIKHLKKSFAAKLMILFIIVICMPMLILSIYMSVSLFHTARENDRIMNQSNLASIVNRLNTYFNGFTYITDSLFVSDTIQELLHNTPDSTYGRLLADRQYSQAIQDITLNNYDIESIYLFSVDGTQYYSPGNRYLENVKRQYEQYAKNQAFNYPLISGFHVNNYLTGNLPAYVILIAQPIYDLKTREFMGIAMIQFYPATLEKLLNYNTDITMITDEYDRVVYDSSRCYLGQPLSTVFPEGMEKPIAIDGQTYIPAFLRTENNSYIIQLKEYESSNIKLFSMTLPIIWMFFGCTIVFITIAILLSNKLIYPIKILQKAMGNVQTDGLSSYVQINTQDEFEELGQSYNRMLDQLNIFIEKSYNQEILHLNAEYRALQSQINPHFLYNALESINSMAQIKQQPEISRMICCLADMFRYTTQQTERLIPLKYEIQHVKNYFQLQNIACDNRISMHYHIDECLLEWTVPKMIIQPVIENCFNHAFEQIDDHSHINLNITSSGNTLIIEVIDNGKGIESDKIIIIRQNLLNHSKTKDTGSSIGLVNINKRIRMLYQDGSGVAIDSLTGVGTRVVITLTEGEKKNVQNSDS